MWTWLTWNISTWTFPHTESSTINLYGDLRWLCVKLKIRTWLWNEQILLPLSVDILRRTHMNHSIGFGHKTANIWRRLIGKCKNSQMPFLNRFCVSGIFYGHLLLCIEWRISGHKQVHIWSQINHIETDMKPISGWNSDFSLLSGIVQLKNTPIKSLFIHNLRHQ